MKTFFVKEIIVFSIIYVVTFTSLFAVYSNNLDVWVLFYLIFYVYNLISFLLITFTYFYVKRKNILISKLVYLLICFLGFLFTYLVLYEYNNDERNLFLIFEGFEVALFIMNAISIVAAYFILDFSNKYLFKKK